MKTSIVPYVAAKNNNEANQFCKIDLIVHDVANSLIERENI